MSSVTTLYIGNDTVLEVRGLKDEVQGAFLNSATVQGTLYDAAGNTVSGQSWPVTLAYVTSSDGEYRATLAYTMGLQAGQKYTARITADGGSGLHAQFDIPCIARTRD